MIPASKFTWGKSQSVHATNVSSSMCTATAIGSPSSSIEGIEIVADRASTVATKVISLAIGASRAVAIAACSSAAQ